MYKLCSDSFLKKLSPKKKHRFCGYYFCIQECCFFASCWPWYFSASMYDTRPQLYVNRTVFLFKTNMKCTLPNNFRDIILCSIPISYRSELYALIANEIIVVEFIKFCNYSTKTRKNFLFIRLPSSQDGLANRDRSTEQCGVTSNQPVIIISCTLRF